LLESDINAGAYYVTLNSQFHIAVLLPVLFIRCTSSMMLQTLINIWFWTIKLRLRKTKFHVPTSC